MLLDNICLTRRSRSFGGSCGSEGDVFGGAVLGLGASFFGGSTFGALSSAFGFSTLGRDDSFGVASSDGATCVSAGWADFDMIATLVPGVTVSPSLAMNYKTTAVSNKSNNPTATVQMKEEQKSKLKVQGAAKLFTFSITPDSGLATSIVT
jgi:hypothetical protein